MIKLLSAQYRYIVSSRSIMLDYVSGMSESDFIRSSPAFGHGSVRNLLVHICDTYLLWIAGRALKDERKFRPYEYYKNLQQCRNYFEEADLAMELFMEKFAADYLSALSVMRNGTPEEISPLKLFMHVITHEFHHKGQIMSLSRDLGYTPVDADVIR